MLQAAKQAEKDAKKQKAAAKKIDAETAKQKAQDGQGESKKAIAKREAEAKKVRWHPSGDQAACYNVDNVNCILSM